MLFQNSQISSLFAFEYAITLATSSFYSMCIQCTIIRLYCIFEYTILVSCMFMLLVVKEMQIRLKRHPQLRRANMHGRMYAARTPMSTIILRNTPGNAVAIARYSAMNKRAKILPAICAWQHWSPNKFSDFAISYHSWVASLSVPLSWCLLTLRVFSIVYLTCRDLTLEVTSTPSVIESENVCTNRFENFQVRRTEKMIVELELVIIAFKVKAILSKTR